MGAAPDLSDASLQMMIYKTFSFRRIFYKKLNHIQVFEVVMNIKWKGKRYPLTASSYRFHENLPLPHSWFYLFVDIGTSRGPKRSKYGTLIAITFAVIFMIEIKKSF